MASWSDSEGPSGGNISRLGSTASDTASGSGRDGASASAASCSSLLGPEAALELLPCAALVFDTQGQLMGVNSKAGDIHTGGEQHAGTPAAHHTRSAAFMRMHQPEGCHASKLSEQPYLHWKALYRTLAHKL